MAKTLFTPEELEELRLADLELDGEFVQTQEEIVESRKRDREAVLDQLDHKSRKIAENQRAYRFTFSLRLWATSMAFFLSSGESSM